MTNKIFLLYIIGCITIQVNAATKPSIYDPLAKLNPTEVNRLEAEGSELIATRKVNGQDLLIQIDFLSEAEFKEGGIEGIGESGRTLFSLGTYSQWSMEYLNEPAVLMLFLDAGGGNYQLDALNFSDMMMDEGIPDLVRKYIRDEIMKKESNLVEIISSGFFAIGEALNPVYIQRLEQKGLEMLNTDKRYHRLHCVYGNCDYFEFIPSEQSVLGPTIPKNGITFDGLPESRSENMREVTNRIFEWQYTHENESVSNWPWIYNNSLKKYVLNPDIPDEYFQVKKDNPWSILTTVSRTKDVAEVLPTMAWLQIHGWPATYCNYFSKDLSQSIFGKIPWGNEMVANDIHSYIIGSTDFLNVLPKDVTDYVELGFICYYSQYGNFKSETERWPGHVAISWIEKDLVIQAGRTTGLINPSTTFNNERLQIHLYLGFLKKK